MKRYLVVLALVGGLLAGTALKAADQKTEKPKPYPLKICLVTGEKLDSMGKPYVVVYKGQEIKFCCMGCEKKFNKEPEVYLKKMKEAEKKAAKEKAKGMGDTQK